MHHSFRNLHIACATAVLFAAGSAPASAQGRNKYTVCKDGTTWLSRAGGVCGRHGGVDPKRSTVANQTLNAYWPRDIELARRREFERRMMAGIHTYESNGAIAKDIRKDEKAAKKAQKVAKKP